MSKAPGFQIGNVFVMAGIPKIMQAMMEALAPRLERGTPVLSRSVTVEGGEGDIAKPLEDIQEQYPAVVIGSYPFESPEGFADHSGPALARCSRARRSLRRREVPRGASLTASGKARGWS